MIRTTSLRLSFFICGALLLFAAPARADDVAPPPLSLADERARFRRQVAVEADAAALLFGEYVVRVGVSPGRYVVVFVSPSYRRLEGLHGAGLELALELRPLGRGLDGLHIGAFGGAAYFPAEQGAARHLRVGADAGYTYAWGQLLVGASVGASRSFVRGPLPPPRRVDLVVRGLIGFAFL